MVLKEREVICRKTHICHGCVDRIHVGQKAYYSAGVNDGDFWTSYFCETCNAFVESEYFSWTNHQDGMDIGDLKEYPVYKLFKENFNLKNQIIKVEVRGGIAYCDDPRVSIIDYDNLKEEENEKNN